MIRLHTLGGATIGVGAARLGPSSTRMFAALLYMAAERGRRVSRSTLQSILFPDSPEQNASHNLRQLLYKLRQLNAPVECDAESARVAPESVEDDYSALLDCSALTPIQIDSVAGGFLPGYAPDFSEPMMDWFEQFRARVTMQLRRSLLAAGADAKGRGDWDLLSRSSRACLVLDPLNEEATLGLAEALAMSGSKVEAVALLDRYAEEVGGAGEDLRIPASILRKRVAERIPESIRGQREAPFLGRRAETAALNHIMTAVKSGESHAVLIWGEPGIGKSRLATELVKSAALSRAVVQQIECRPHYKHRPLAAFVDLIPLLKELPGSLGCSPDSLALLSRITHHAIGDSGLRTPELGDPDIRMALLCRAISELFDAICSEAPLLIIVEDAHWLDDASIRILGELIAEKHARPLLLVLTSREGAILTESVDHVDRLRKIRLTGLDSESAKALADEHLGKSSPVHPEVCDWLQSTSEGNPLLIQVLIRHYRETGVRFGVPLAVQDMLWQRVVALGEDAELALLCITILGKHCTLGRLERITGLQPYSLLVSLSRLESAGLIVTDASRVKSAHDVLSDVVTAKSPCSARQLLHHRAAELLQIELQTSREASLLWDCSEHWMQAGDAPAAISLLCSCAEHAIQLGQPEEAHDLLARALGLSIAEDERISILRRILDAAEGADDWPVVIEHIQSLRVAYNILHGSGSMDASWAVRHVHAMRMLGRDTIELRPELRRIMYDDTIPSETRIEAGIEIIVAAELESSATEAWNAYDVVSAIVADLDEPPIPAQIFLIVFHTCFGNPAEARRRAEELVATQGSGRLELGMLGLWRNMAYALVRTGNLYLGKSLARRCFEVAKAARFHPGASDAAALLAWADLETGDYDSARVWHVESERARTATRRGICAPMHYASAVTLALADGDIAGATEWMERTARECPGVAAGRFRLDYLSLELKVRRAQGNSTCTSAELNEILAGHMMAREFGLHDPVMEAVWFGLLERNRTAEARALLIAYLSRYRRDGIPLSSALLKICNSAQLANANGSSSLSVLLPYSGAVDDAPTAAATQHS